MYYKKQLDRKNLLNIFKHDRMDKKKTFSLARIIKIISINLDNNYCENR